MNRCFPSWEFIGNLVAVVLQVLMPSMLGVFNLNLDILAPIVVHPLIILCHFLDEHKQEKRNTNPLTNIHIKTLARIHKTKSHNWKHFYQKVMLSTGHLLTHNGKGWCLQFTGQGGSIAFLCTDQIHTGLGPSVDGKSWVILSKAQVPCHGIIYNT